MKTKKVSQLYDTPTFSGIFIGFQTAQESPLEEGVFLIPGGCVDSLPPDWETNQIPRWTGTGWEILPDYRDVVFFSKSDFKNTKYYELGEEPNWTTHTNKSPIENELLQVFDESLNCWKVDPQKLFILRAKLKNETKIRLESSISTYRGKVEVSGIEWDSGQRFLENINKTLLVKSKNPTLELPPWRDFNNINHPVTVTNLEEIRDAIELDLFNEGNRLYQRKWEIEAVIDSLSLEEIESFEINFR